jgi:uncharacterized protein (TIGR02285 family)
MSMGYGDNRRRKDTLRVADGLAMLLVLAPLLTFLISLTPTFANAADTHIRWLIFDFPPIYVVSGPQKGTGALDYMEDDLKRNLPQYSHSRSALNIKRVLATIEKNQQACASGLLWTQGQAEYIEYSLPFMFVLPPRFVVRKKELARFKPFTDANGRVSLKQLLTGSGLVLGFSSARAYSKTLAPIIDQYSNKSNSIESHLPSITKPLINMLTRNRFDYTIAYPSEVRFLSQELGISPEQFITIPIQESDWAQHAYVGCPKTEWGRQIISDVNGLIKKLRIQPDFYGHYTAWLDAGSTGEYKKILARGFDDAFPPARN